MVIVTVEHCLQQISSQTEEKIIVKQNQFVTSSSTFSLQDRLLDPSFRKTIVQSLNSLEKKYVPSFIKKYNSYLRRDEKEEQTTEEKLALLLLQQKGFIYKVQFFGVRTHVLPLEVIDSFYEATFQLKKIHGHRPLATKKYIYYLTELLSHYKEQNSFVSLSKLSDDKVTLSLLVDFLVSEELLTKNSTCYVVNEQGCLEFFQKCSDDIKYSLAHFFTSRMIENSFVAELLLWCLFRSLDYSFTVTDIVNYCEKHNQAVSKSFFDLLAQLRELEIITIEQDHLAIARDQIDQGKLNGIESGVMQFMVPVYIDNHSLYVFRSWGEFQQWETMVEVLITRQTVERALKYELNVEVFEQALERYISDDNVNNWRQSFQQWITTTTFITKKENVIYYFLKEKLHQKWIEKHWQGWSEWTNSGVVIEAKNKNKFEELIEKISLRIVEQTLPEVTSKQKLPIVVIDEYPDVSSILPEVANVPKQWFRLTSYDERAISRIVKQAIVLQLPLQIETREGDIIKLLPTTIIVNHGIIRIKTKDNKQWKIEEFKKIAIVHPNELAI